jgi:hypothetical protein
MRNCVMQVRFVRTEPGSGGCLDALNPRETRGARVAPTPSPPVEERPKSRGGSLRMCLGQDRRDAAPQTPLRKVQFVGGVVGVMTAIAQSIFGDSR